MFDFIDTVCEEEGLKFKHNIPVIKLVLGLFQVRLWPSWHCFAIPWGWHRNAWRRGWVPHYGRLRTIWKQRWQWEEAYVLGTWLGEVLITPQLIKLQGWEGRTRVILAYRRGVRYPLSPPSTTSSHLTKSGGGGVPDCRFFLCSDQTWQLLATFWGRSSDRVEDLKVLRNVPNVLNCCHLNDNLVSFW